MSSTPAAIPETTPETEPTVALEPALVHKPPVVALVTVAVEPSQTLSVPPIAAGNGLTTIFAVAIQPVESVYVIVAAPAVIPVTTPDIDPTVTFDELVDQTPPVVALDNVADEATHTFEAPVIADGNALTRKDAVAIQPVGNV